MPAHRPLELPLALGLATGNEQQPDIFIFVCNFSRSTLSSLGLASGWNVRSPMSPREDVAPWAKLAAYQRRVMRELRGNTHHNFRGE